MFSLLFPAGSQDALGPPLYYYYSLPENIRPFPLKVCVSSLLLSWRPSALPHAFIVLTFATFFLVLIKTYILVIVLEFALLNLLSDVHSGLRFVRMRLRKN